MGTIWVFAEVSGGKVATISLELLARARELADTVEAVVGADGELVAAELGAHGLLDPMRACLGAKPVLGICMGLQVLFETSDEAPDTPGLGWLAGGAIRFPADAVDAQGRRLKVPHMGWNRVRQRMDHPLWRGIDDTERFYFVHSYHVCPDDPGVVAGTSEYGREFPAAVAGERLFAVQFHPEKSQRAGLALLSNFLAWGGGA